ncbi:MAG: alkaline phosphatase [Acidobacteria bacterium]|nr:alkaline phosphatase [Acidobacteriota bacterium]
MRRRDFLKGAAAPFAAAGSPGTGRRFPALLPQLRSRPRITHGIQCGDVTADRAIIWSRSDRPARMIVEYSTRESFADSRRIIGPAAIESTDFTARVDLGPLPRGQEIFYRVSFEDLDSLRATSEPMIGRLQLPPLQKRDLTFVWGGDVAGQGWGINPDIGGMKIFDSMRRIAPDFFIHSGDTIYADNPIPAEVILEDGRKWRNLTSPEKSKVAETLDEFRGNYRYNLLDEPLRQFNASVPILAQWDDHEVLNNWYPGKRLDEDPRYTVKSADLLAARARRAFFDYLPLRPDRYDPERIYRAFAWGPSLEVLMLDERSYRGPNTANLQTVMSDETAFLGRPQIDWIRQRLLRSTATWKVIASDMPLGLIVGDSGGRFEAVANGENGAARGRELEIAGLLSFIKQRRIRNVIWVTADVHYAAAHHYHPGRARFTDFLPFWEFVAGPLNAGTFGPGRLDETFGPRVEFVSIPGGPKAMKPNRSPLEGHQFFGAVRIDGRTETLTVTLHDLNGKELYRQSLAPHQR